MRGAGPNSGRVTGLHAARMTFRSSPVVAIWAYRGRVAAPLPDDADSWSDDEWLSWLEEVAAETPPEPDGHPARPRRSLPSSLIGAAMLGMHRVIYGDTEPDIQIVVDADGEPPEPEKLEVHLDPDDPDESTVTVRPWIEDP